MGSCLNRKTHKGVGAGGGDQNGKPDRTSFSLLRMWACLSSLLNFCPLSNSRFSFLTFSFYPRGRAGREGDDQGESYKAKVKYSAPTTTARLCIVVLKKGKQRPWPKCTQRNRVVDVDRSTVLGTPYSGPVRTRGLVGPVVIEAGAGNPTRESELPGASVQQPGSKGKKQM